MISKKTRENSRPWLLAKIRLARIKLAKAAVKILLPPDIWIANHKGEYTCKWSVHLGKVDSWGVLQGVEDHKA